MQLLLRVVASEPGNCYHTPAMLVLSRKTGERVWIGEDIVITIVRVSGGGVRLGIEAPDAMPVVREELKKKLDTADHAGPESSTATP